MSSRNAANPCVVARQPCVTVPSHRRKQRQNGQRQKRLLPNKKNIQKNRHARSAAGVTIKRAISHTRARNHTKSRGTDRSIPINGQNSVQITANVAHLPLLQDRCIHQTQMPSRDYPKSWPTVGYVHVVKPMTGSSMAGSRSTVKLWKPWAHA